MQSEELVVLVDNNNNPIGTAEKDTVHTTDTPLHRAFSLFIFNSHNQVLLTKRASSKKTFPGVWTNTVCGHLAPEETPVAAATRRLQEELGISGIQLQNIGSTHAQDTGEKFKRRHMFRVYVCKAVPVKLQKDEVKSVFWSNPKDLYEDMQVNSEKYTGGFKNTIKLFLSQTVQ